MKNQEQIKTNLLAVKSMVDATLALFDEPIQTNVEIVKKFEVEPEQDLWQTANIRQLLTQGFGPQELKTFCFDTAKFRQVYDSFGNDTGKVQVAHLLIDYGQRHNCLGTLLGWCKIQNPKMYDRFKPYGMES